MCGRTRVVTAVAAAVEHFTGLLDDGTVVYDRDHATFHGTGKFHSP